MVVSACAIFAVAVVAFLQATSHSTIRTGDFILTQKVSAQSDLRISFPEAMDTASVEKSLVIPSDLTGDIRWEGNDLVFHPTTTLERGSKYVFHLKRDAARAGGDALGQDFDFTFVISGAPSVSARFPAPNSKEVATDAGITLVFDRPLVPLAQLQGEASQQRMPNWPVTISPPLNGKWRWLSSMSVSFVADEPLKEATEYTIAVPIGISTVAKEKTEEEFSWKFETKRPAVLQTSPDQGSSLAGPDTPIILTFNQPIDLSNAASHIQISTTPAPGKIIPIRDIRYGSTRENGKEISSRSVLVLQPAQPLIFNTSYDVIVQKDIKGTTGNLGSVEDFHLAFRTAGPLKVEQANYQDGLLAVSFSNPVSSGSIANGITISPEPGGWKEILVTPSPWSENKRVELYVSFKPSTSYTVTVLSSVTDLFGQKLSQPYVYTFKTRPLPPQTFIHSRGEFGIFERGKSPVYYLNAVNVSKLNVVFAKLPLEKFLEIREAKTAGIPFKPSLEQESLYKTWSIKPPKNKLDEWEIAPFDVEKQVGQTLAAGIYALTLQAPEYKDEIGMPIVEQQYFALTNMSVTLKYSGKQALAWVTDLRTGEPISDATVRIYSLDKKVQAEGKTDKQGFFQASVAIHSFPMSNNYYQQAEFWVTAEKDGDFAFVSSDWSDGLRSYDFSLWSDFQGPWASKFRVNAYLYTERPMYGAGDKVHFKGIVRLRDWDGNLRMPTKDESALVTITDSNGNKAYEKTLRFTEFGSFNDSFPLDKAAPLGQYGINMSITPETEVGQNSTYGSFNVLAYRKPEYRIALTTKEPDYYDRQTVTVNVEGSYYFGAPLANAKMEWRAQTTDYYFNRYTDGWYSFALQDAWCWRNCERETGPLTEGFGKLDAAGRATISVPMDIRTKAVSQIATIEADITDANNQIVSSRVSVPVHKSSVYVGVRMEDYIITPGKKARVALVSVKPDGSPAPNQSVKVQLFSRTWNTIQKKGVDGEFYEENEPKDTFVRDVIVSTDAKGKAITEVLFEKGGEFSIIASTKDSGGRESKAGTSAYAWSSTYVNWPHTNNDRIDMEADKPEYVVGDTAKFLVKSPYQGKGVKALVTVERENVLTKKVIDVTSNALPIEVPITENMIPNAYVSVVIIKPREGETFDKNGLDTGAPAFKIGYAELNVEKKSKQVSIKIETDKTHYLPAEPVNVKIRTVDAKGKPVKAEVSLGVVDTSVLAISGFEMPYLLETFYSQHGLGVNTAQLLTFLLERYKPGSKGGGGADLDARKRGNFKDTAFWTPSVVTNANGEATLTFTLPDNLTTWQLLAIGHTKENTFGASKTEIVETKKVIVRPVRPRFGVRDDKVTLGAIVHNQLPDAQTFSVTLTGSGFSALGSMSQTVKIAAGENKKVLFPVQIKKVKSASLIFKAVSPSGKDEIEEKIPVYAYGTPQAVTTTGMTENAIKESILIPTAKDAQDGSVRITVSPSLATYLPGGLEYLATYPYGCAEQTISAIMPNVALENLQGFDAFRFVDAKVLETNITTSLQRLYDFQRGDGGFGYWNESQQSYPYLTAYIVHSMQIIKSKHTVDDGVIVRARAYLNETLRNQDLHKSLDLATRSYIIYVLAEGGSVDGNLALNLYEKREKLPLFAKAYLAMSLQKTKNTEKAKQLLSDVVNNAKIDPRGTHFEEKNENLYSTLMHTNTRSTAIILQALVRIDPGNTLLPNIVRYLLAVREQGHWDTTQSTVVSILALIDYVKNTKELDASFQAAVDMNGKGVIRQTFEKKNVLTRQEVLLGLDSLTRGSLNEVKIGKNGTGRLYYDIEMSYFYTADSLPPLEEGISIMRDLQPITGQSADLRVGGTYKVSLTMTVPEERHFVAVVSPLPAGMEAIDLSSNVSQQLLLEDEANKTKDPWSYQDPISSAQWLFQHKEYRDDSVFLFADTLPAGVYKYEYLVRATTPGTYHYRPAHMWEMYYPETFGQTEGSLMTIND